MPVVPPVVDFPPRNGVHICHLVWFQRYCRPLSSGGKCRMLTCCDTDFFF
jgi:hypothetical protein